jgi:hypothetical protein
MGYATVTDMYRNLRKLCVCYIQDFDLVYKRPTDPIDQFCSQNNTQTQNEALREMIDFFQRFQAGERSHKDLVKMGLEYTPGADRESLDWVRDAIEYLRVKTQRGPQRHSPRR